MPICNYVVTTSAAIELGGTRPEGQEHERQRSGTEDFVSSVFTVCVPDAADRVRSTYAVRLLNLRCSRSTHAQITVTLSSGREASLNMLKDSSRSSHHATSFPLPSNSKRPLHAPCLAVDAPFPFVADFLKFSGRELIGVQ